MPAALVFAAAPIEPTPRLRSRLDRLRAPFVVAADAGAASALALGFRPDVLIGDFDSLDPTTLDALSSVPIERYPRDKDATDGQLAIERALRAQASELWLVGFLGGPRLDQALANVLLLTRIQVPSLMLDGHNECRLVRPAEGQAWTAETPEIVSLLPLSADVRGVRTSGLRWPLQDASLSLGDTRGVSNEPVGTSVSVSVETGLLLLTRHFPP